MKLVEMEPIVSCTCANSPLPGAPPAKALLTSYAGRACILAHIGFDIDYELENVGPEWTLDGMENGVWVVECKIRSWRDYFGEHDYELEILTQRQPTEEEWVAWVTEGAEPWEETFEDYYANTSCEVHP